VDIIIHQDGLSAIEEICGRFDVETLQAPVFQHSFLGDLRSYGNRLIRADDGSGGVTVIKEGGIIRKPFRREKLFRVQAPIGLAELSMSFGRDFAPLDIGRHVNYLKSRYTCSKKYFVFVKIFLFLLARLPLKISSAHSL
jgi:hypothetical protein